MLIGIPKEIKADEGRVSLTPASVKLLTTRGHQVLVETGAGIGSSISDSEYVSVGAQIVKSPDEVWAADLVVKVKEPIAREYQYFRKDLSLFTYLHLASNAPLTRVLLDSGISAIAYETVENSSGQLPLLMPMSIIAGRMATQVGAMTLQSNQGGRGVLMGGAPGVAPAKVVILGGGTVGLNAARIAVGMGANVTILDVNYARLNTIDEAYQGRIQTRKSNEHAIQEAITKADLVIGAVLIPGSKAPWLITRKMLSTMPPKAVIVDVAVDQGGCVETSKPTTHSAPTYVVDDISHYCVANMPGAVPRTSTFALNSQTADYVLALADQQLAALLAYPGFIKGLNIHQGNVTNQAVADALKLPYHNPTL